MDKHFIVLNGKRYDAVTGTLLGPALDSRLSSRAHTTVANPHISRMQPPAKQAASAVVAAPAAPRPRPVRDHHGQPKVVVHHRPEPAKTLMRTVVHKPDTKALPIVKQQYPVTSPVRGVPIARKLSISSVSGSRLERAQQVKKSQHVDKFAQTHSVISTQLKPLAVASAPAHAHIAPVPALSQATQEVVQKASTIFEQAIASATTHEQPQAKAKKKRSLNHRKLVSSFAALGAVLIVGGFLAFANKATVELQVASVRAGFQASMPAYAPEGFARQAAHASHGSVAINFVSPANNHAFTLTQQSSDWDSQTLFDSVVAQSDSSYQTAQSSGRTIYIYGNDQAAWVDGGVLYKVSGNSGLNSDQIISLAASM